MKEALSAGRPCKRLVVGVIVEEKQDAHALVPECAAAEGEGRHTVEYVELAIEYMEVVEDRIRLGALWAETPNPDVEGAVDVAHHR